MRYPATHMMVMLEKIGLYADLLNLIKITEFQLFSHYRYAHILPM